MLTEPTSIPTTIALLDDPDDAIRAASTQALNSCLHLGAYRAGDSAGPAVVERYRAWWNEHRDDYLDAAASIWNGESPPVRLDAVTDVRRLFDSWTAAPRMRTEAPEARRIVALGASAIPELKTIAADSTVRLRHLAYLLIAEAGGRAAVPFLVESAERDTSDDARRIAVVALDKILGLGAYEPGSSDSAAVIERYREWARKNSST